MKLVFITATFWLLALSQGLAHSMMTAYLDMVEAADGSTSVSWRRPVFPGTMVTLEPIFPVDVIRVSSEPISDEGTFSRDRYIVRGAARLWSDAVIGVKGEAPSGLEVLIRLELANGQKHVAVLRNPSDQFAVPKQPSIWRAALSYFRLGLDHILMGMDHLLFVLGLLILVPNRGMLIKTITAFTIAHSITLGIATLGYASAPLPPSSSSAQRSFGCSEERQA